MIKSNCKGQSLTYKANIENYNQSYEFMTPQWLSNTKVLIDYMQTNNQTLCQVIDDVIDRFQLKLPIKMLDCGCGLGGLALLLRDRYSHYLGIDFSSLAIAAAKDIKESHFLDRAQFACDDLSSSLTIKTEQFDLVIDSHLYHCLTHYNQVNQYFQNIKDMMHDSSLFVIETMCYQDQLQLPVGYFLDDDLVLYKDNLAIRKIPQAQEFEQQLICAGFKIEYFYYHAELAFHVFPEFDSYPFEYLPKTLRVAVRKASN